jgi:hydrogenase nickel incorporation protein HypA/HybF
MHELSIISSVVDSVMESLAAYPGARVKEVRLRVGALAAVVEDSLQFCYGIATEDTPLAGSVLVVKTLPVRVHCVPCRAFAVQSAASRRRICGRGGSSRSNRLRLRKLRRLWGHDHADC